MKKRYLASALVVAIALVLTQSMSAWALRCHGRIVSPGDTRYDVASKCGEPTAIEERNEAYFGGYAPGLTPFGIVAFPAVESILIEEWIYNFGPTRLMYYLIFENGRLKRIETGGYGYY